jgi:hypothetical protein
LSTATPVNDNAADFMPPLARALATRLRQLMPTVDELAIAPDDAGPSGLGPEVTVPALWLHLLITECEILALQLLGGQMDRREAARQAYALMLLPDPAGAA